MNTVWNCIDAMGLAYLAEEADLSKHACADNINQLNPFLEGDGCYKLLATDAAACDDCACHVHRSPIIHSTGHVTIESTSDGDLIDIRWRLEIHGADFACCR